MNFHAFAANLFERRIIHTSPLWAIWAHRDAHEGRPNYTKESGVPDEIYLLAAAQWILWYGQSLFKQVIFAGEIFSDDLQMQAPGPYYDGKAYLTIHRWRFWKDGYIKVAASGKEEGYSQEYKDVAAKAVALMNAFENNMMFK